MNHHPAWPLRIYYDRSCPLCAQEMHALAAHDPAGRIELVDCSRADFDPAAEEGAGASSTLLAAVVAGEAPDAGKPTRAALMTIIHARDADGRWYRGVEGLRARLRGGRAGCDGAHLGASVVAPVLGPRLPLVRAQPPVAVAPGTSRAYGWLLNRAAARAARRSGACADGVCRRP